MNELQKSFNEFIKDLEEAKINEECVIEQLVRVFEDDFIDLYFGLKECDSPIERMLFVQLRRCMEMSSLQSYWDVFEITTQYKIEIDENTKYRLDFYVIFNDMRNKIKREFAIECDGHDFHEKTKEQAKRDKRRDRDLLAKGITVIRFTGSEIYNDAFGCAREAVRTIEKQVEAMYK